MSYNMAQSTRGNNNTGYLKQLKAVGWEPSRITVACEAALTARYGETEAKRNEVLDKISQLQVRRRKVERFIQSVGELPELFTEFDAAQWASLVDSMTVHRKERIVFRLTCGMEIEA